MRVTLVNPPYPPGYIMVKESAACLGLAIPRGKFKRRLITRPPLALLYTAAAAEQGGHEVRIIESEAQHLKVKDILTTLSREHPDAIGILLGFPSLDHDLHLAHLIKTNSPGSRVFLFGSSIRFTWKQWIAKTNADFIFYGEPESIIADFLTLASPELGPQIGAYPVERLQQGQWVPQEKDWRIVEDLDVLPFPAWHLVPIDAYKHHGNRELFYMVSSQGCPRNCSVCPYTLHQGRRWRTRSLQNVLDELRYLHDKLGTRQVIFHDPNIIIDKKRFADLMHGIIDNQLNMDISLETSLEDFTPEILSLCKEAGVSQILTGIESAAEECLQEIGQDPLYLEDLRKNVSLCKSLGIQVFGFFLVGFANDSWESIFKTLAFSKELNMIGAHFNTIMPYYGTRVRQEALAENRFTDNYSYLDYNTKACLMRTKYLTIRDVKLAAKFMACDYRLDYLLKAAKDPLSWKKWSSALMLSARLLKYWFTVQVLRLRVQLRRNWSRTVEVPPPLEPAGGKDTSGR